MSISRSKHAIILIIVLLSGTIGENLKAYPIDGYALTGIRRLLYLQMVLKGEINANPSIKGAQLSIDSIKLNLTGSRGDSLAVLPMTNPELQKSIASIFPNLDESYSITVLDITAGRPVRYACSQEKKQFQPGSVGKLIVIAGLFNELKAIYPDSFEQRQALLKRKSVRGGKWAVYDEHTVPVFDTATKKLVRRRITENDVFSLYEWADHMLSASNNGAANVIWRETILMHEFGKRYPFISESEANDFFSQTPRAQLMQLAVEVVNQPTIAAGISASDWKLGSMFTGEAKKIIPGSGGSSASPYGLMKFLVALERGKIVDEASSLEIKRLMYMTASRIRYASSSALTSAAVYFKSGSLYQCREEEGYTCEKYKGNVNNYMNSVIIVEHPDGTSYLVCLMSNVLKRNSASDHNALASRIDRAIRKI